MPRTKPNLVRKIITVNEEDDLQAAIDSATNLVDQVCLHSGYNDTTLELIERWLAAHFYDIFKKEAVQENIGQSQNTYQSKIELGLRLTHWGQQALLLDTKGNLAALDNKQKNLRGRPPSVKWVGGIPREQINTGGL